MSKFVAFDPDTNQRVLRLVDELPLINLATDQVLCVPGGRLTSSDTNPLADGFNFSTLRYLPYVHNLVPLWNSSLNQWIYREISSLSPLSLSSLTTNRTYDVCLYLDGADGTVQWATRTWSTNTSRGFILEQDGIHFVNVGSGNLAKATYLGSIYVTGPTNGAWTNDTETQRFVYNAHNRVEKPLLRLAAGNWTYNSATWRSWNNSLTNRVEMLDGSRFGVNLLNLTFSSRVVTPQGSFGQIGIGINRTTSPNNGAAIAGGVVLDTSLSQRVCIAPGIGVRYAQALESVVGGGNVLTYAEGFNGLIGVWPC